MARAQFRSNDIEFISELIGPIRSHGNIFQDHAALIFEFLADSEVKIKVWHVLQTRPPIAGAKLPIWASNLYRCRSKSRAGPRSEVKMPNVDPEAYAVSSSADAASFPSGFFTLKDSCSS
jgi:hypothetical protein